jgi:N-acetylglucosaminyl-diphospho-decaprenol L-rhamnosyltransferase
MRAALEENIVDRALIFSSQAKKRHLVPRRQPRQQLGGRLAAVARVEPGRKRRANEKSAPYVAVAFSFVLGSDTGPSLGNVGSIVAAPARRRSQDRCHTRHSVTDVSVIVASHNAREYIERCVGALSETRHEVIVVDSASSDGTAEFVRERFPDVRLVPLSENRGYGAALNEGIGLSGARYFLLMNGDAWPQPGAIEELLEFAESQQRAGVIGPRLLNPNGTLQPSVRGFPTLWRLATEYFFLRWFAPRSRAFNAFYSGGFNHQSVRDAEFLVGAVLLVHREVVDEIGVFDTSFFMFNEEVDFCYRVREAGWRVVFYPGAEFVHMGGASTAAVWQPMYREQLRSHLRFLAKHDGMREAERARKLLAAAMRIRALVFGILGRRERRALSLDAGTWLRSGDTSALLQLSSPDNTL